MYASMKRGFEFSSVTVSRSIVPTPGSSSSGERSRSGSYIGCGNDGANSTDSPARRRGATSPAAADTRA